MSLEVAGNALSRALGLQDKHVKLLIRTGWVIAVTSTMCWVTGLAAFLGVGAAPYATAGEVKELTNSVTEIRVQMLEERLLDTRLKQCKAILEHNDTTKQYYWEQLNKLMRQYYSLTQENYNAPACEEIM